MVIPLDPEEFRRQGHMLIDFIADYYQNIENYKVLSQVEPGYLEKLLPESAPFYPESIETILQDVQKYIIPGITHWQSPNYFAYFPSSGSIAGFLGEILSTGFNVVGFNWMSSPAATELECIVMDWLGEMLMLPKSFLFKGTTCEAILCTLAAARDQMLNRCGSEKKEKLVVYGSDQTHSALQKAAQIAGIHTKNFRLSHQNYEVKFVHADVEAGLVPFFLCATVGTTSTNAIDPIGPLCAVAKDFNIWVHADAAYAGSACICPKFHCCCLWVKDPSALIKSLSTNPEFLRDKATDSKLVVDYKDWQITLSRRFRAMKLWLVLRSYGVANLRNFLRSHVKMAKLFEELLRNDDRFEVVAPRNFALLNKKLLESINGSGNVYMSSTMVDGAYIIRCAIGATLTEERHVIRAWKVIQEHADALFSKK
ncbi:hypothetical protein ACB098_05G217200 [Castanea mollissima]